MNADTPRRAPDPVRVAYLVGPARSGSSVVTSLLGELPGAFAAAEMRLAWHGWHDRRCGCGAALADCPIWAPVLADAMHAIGADDPQEVVALQAQVTRLRHLGRVVRALRAERRGTALPESLQRYRRLLSTLYRGIAATSGAQVIVDSSKAPAEAAILSTVQGVELHLVHVLRDPRAIAYSWQRAIQRGAPAQGQGSARASAANWMKVNLGAEALAIAVRPVTHSRLRYEDLVEHPRAALTRLAARLGCEPDLRFLDVHAARSSRHMVGGNALRFASKVERVRPDLEWREAMDRRAAMTVTAITAPLLPAYGYPLRLPLPSSSVR